MSYNDSFNIPFSAKFCFDQTFFYIMVLSVLIIVACQFMQMKNYYEYKYNNKQCDCPESSQEPKIQKVDVVNEVPAGPPTDVIREYDYNKAFDPLEQPVRRVPRHEMHPLHLKRMIDIPSRGYPDNFTQVGVLVLDSKGKKSKNDENRIIRLFGRQEYPGSYRYEYYTSVNSGLDKIKIPIDIRTKKELYDGDSVYIKELDDRYTVQLHKYDEPKYYPDIIF